MRGRRRAQGLVKQVLITVHAAPTCETVGSGGMESTSTAAEDQGPGTGCGSGCGEEASGCSSPKAHAAPPVTAQLFKADLMWKGKGSFQADILVMINYIGLED